MRSAVATIASIVGIGTCVQLGLWISAQDFLRFGLQSNLVVSFLAHYQLPPDFFAHHEAVIPYCVALVVVVVLLVALVQSLAQYRRAQARAAVMLKYSVILALLTFAGTLWCSDLIRSLRGGGWQLTGELQQASVSFWQKRGGQAVNGACTVTLQDLEQTGGLFSEKTKAWIRNSRITLTPVSFSDQRKPPHLQVLVVFPNGAQYFFEKTLR